MEKIDEFNDIQNENQPEKISTTMESEELLLNEEKQTILAENTEIQNELAEIVEKTNEVQRSEEELALEQQLNDVQKQLVALASLPSTIQATLDAVTRQLSELLPTFQLINSEKPDNNNQNQGKISKNLKKYTYMYLF